MERSFIIDDFSEHLIVSIVDDRCYIKPSAVHVSEEGIFLIDGNEMFPIAQLEADEQGVFFRIVSDYEKCPSCGKTKRWGKCRTEGCSRYGTEYEQA